MIRTMLMRLGLSRSSWRIRSAERSPSQETTARPYLTASLAPTTILERSHIACNSVYSSAAECSWTLHDGRNTRVGCWMGFPPLFRAPFPGDYYSLFLDVGSSLIGEQDTYVPVCRERERDVSAAAKLRQAHVIFEPENSNRTIRCRSDAL